MADAKIEYSLTAEQRNDIGLELMRANDLLELATYRASNFCNDSPLLTLIAATGDRVRAARWARPCGGSWD
jgi:hypothetical protein